MRIEPSLPLRVILAGVALAALWAVILSPAAARAQPDTSAPGPLLVGVLAAPPFMMQTPSGRWEGIGIELWQEIAQMLDLEFEWREYGSLGDIRRALARGEIDGSRLAFRARSV